MPDKPNVVFVYGSDWEGMYINDKLAVEGHNLDARVVLRSLGHQYDYEIADDECLQDEGSLPINLKGVKIAK